MNPRSLWRRLARFFQRRSIRRTLVVDRAGDLPRPLKTGVLYVVGKPRQWAMFACPCAQGHDIALRIDQDGAWTIQRDGRRPTIHPSINSFENGQRCHYWITNGHTHWCPDSTNP